MLDFLNQQNIPPQELPSTQPLVADLLVAYAFDLPAAFQMVTIADLQRLELSADELHQIALANLRKHIDDVRIEGDAPVSMMTLGGDLGSCLLLLDEVWESLAAEVPGQLVVSVPTRSILLFTSSDSPEGLSLLRELTTGAWERESTHRLSDQLIVRRGGSWACFQEDA